VAKKKRTFEESKAAFYAMTKPGENGCIIWIGSFGGVGGAEPYGHFLKDGHWMSAAKASWEFEHECKMPEGLEAMHTCNNRGCVNPQHIVAGTRSENLRQSPLKHRHSPDHPAALVAYVKATLLAGEPVLALCRRLGINFSTVHNWKSGRSRADVEPAKL
jgi:hypothetical protein